MGSHRVGHNWSDLAAAAAGLSPVQKHYKTEGSGKIQSKSWKGKIHNLEYSTQQDNLEKNKR